MGTTNNDNNDDGDKGDDTTNTPSDDNTTDDKTTTDSGNNTTQDTTNMCCLVLQCASGCCLTHTAPFLIHTKVYLCGWQAKSHKGEEETFSEQHKQFIEMGLEFCLSLV